jgi:hypothetical protein
LLSRMNQQRHGHVFPFGHEMSVTWER